MSSPGKCDSDLPSPAAAVLNAVLAQPEAPEEAAPSSSGSNSRRGPRLLEPGSPRVVLTDVQQAPAAACSAKLPADSVRA